MTLKSCKNNNECKVLIAEDDDLLRLMIGMQLAESKILFCAAPDGHQVLALFKAHRPKVLILDISMPGLSGFDVVKILRTDPLYSDYQNLNLIIHTSHDLSRAEQKELTLGPTVFYVKTIRDDLAQTVCKILAE